MYAPTNTSAPSPTAPGTRSTSRPTVMQIASMSAMKVVPRMKPSTAWYARRAIASLMSPEPRGTSDAQGPGRPVRVPQEEEDEQQREDRHGDGLAHDADPADHPGRRRAAELAQQFLGVGGEVVERGAGRPEVLGQRLGGLLERGDDLVAGVDQRG